MHALYLESIGGGTFSMVDARVNLARAVGVHACIFSAARDAMLSCLIG